jgi:hemerythrin-like metal-binding protein
MPTLDWSDDLALKQPQIDATHREFVELLAQAEAALQLDPAELLRRFAKLIEHTVEHFAQEDRWMAATGFAPENCHSFQHAAVLQVMRDVAGIAREAGDFTPLRRAIGELAQWFPMHASMMDAALAHHMAQVGYDPADPEARALPSTQALITGCGHRTCTS